MLVWPSILTVCSPLAFNYITWRISRVSGNGVNPTISARRLLVEDKVLRGSPISCIRPTKTLGKNLLCKCSGTSTFRRAEEASAVGASSWMEMNSKEARVWY